MNARLLCFVATMTAFVNGVTAEYYCELYDKIFTYSESVVAAVVVVVGASVVRTTQEGGVQ